MAKKFEGLSADVIERVQELDVAFNNMGSSVSEINKQLRQSGEIIISVDREVRTVGTSFSRIGEIQERIRKSSKGLNDAIKEQNRLRSTTANLAAKLKIVQDKIRTTTGSTRDLYIDIEDAILNQLDRLTEAEEVMSQMVDDARELDKKTGFFTNAAAFIDSLPGLRFLTPSFLEAEEAARDRVIETGSRIQGYRAGALSLGKSIMHHILNPLTFAFGAKGLIKLIAGFFFEANSRVIQLSKALNVARADGANLLVEYNSLITDISVIGRELTQEVINLNKEFGTTVSNVGDLAKTSLQLQNYFDVNAEAAGKLAGYSRVINTNYQQLVEEIIGLSEVEEARLGIALSYKNVLEEISRISAYQKLLYKDQINSLTQAVVLAKSFGLTLESIEKIGRGFLDFESSITAELEAELLTGKQLNFERMRYLALTNDIAGVTEEVANQIGTAADFMSMNRLAAEAYAKAFGLSRDELSSMLFESEQLLQLGRGQEQITTAQFNRLVQIHGEEQAIKQLGQERFERQKNLIEAQEVLNRLFMQLKDALVANIAPIFEDLVNRAGNMDQLIKNIVKGINTFAKGVKIILPIVAGIASGLTVAAAALTFGLAPAAGLAVAAGAIGTIGTAALINDGVVSPDGGLVISGPKGSIQTNKDDYLIATTNNPLQSNTSSGRTERLLEQIAGTLKDIAIKEPLVYTI